MRDSRSIFAVSGRRVISGGGDGGGGGGGGAGGGGFYGPASPVWAGVAADMRIPCPDVAAISSANSPSLQTSGYPLQ